MESLVKLDVSHNQLPTLLDFYPPKNLIEVNFSHNVIDELPDLSKHCHLVTLILDYNNIEEINGLSHCYCLKKLSMVNNNIQRISGLSNLPLTHLNLSHNSVKKIENLDTLKYLKVLDLSCNYIRSLKGLQEHEFLQEINLEGNQIIDIAEIRYIRELRLLRKLNFQRNPIQEMSDYRLSILFRLQTLKNLDGVDVTANEKVHATNMFNPPRDVIAARDHMVHVVRSLMQPARVFESTLTSLTTPYPMLVLTGPSGCGKRSLVKKLCQEFPDFFGLGISTTTRPQRRKEDDGIDYFFTTQEEFEKDVMEGKFIETAQCGGYLYGITREAIESVAGKGLACALHMEFEGVLSLKNTSFEPRYILILPETTKEHERRLREHSHYSESLIARALDRVEMYANVNREKPGFFDMTFVSDDLHELYRKLKMLVLDYLGLSPTATTDSEFITNSFTDMSSGSRGSEECPRGSEVSTATTTASRVWSRPRSDISNSFARTNLSFQSSKISSVEQASVERRRTLAKAALAGIPYVSKEQLNHLGRSDAVSQRINDNFSTLLKLQRSLSAPVDLSNFSLLVNASTLNTEPQETRDNIRSDFDSDSGSDASSVTPSSARAFSPNIDRADSDASREGSPVSLGTFHGSTPVRVELLENTLQT
ncbi:leucine-rich repeat and guanylate kinase domain-containing protein-like isoform X2 [Dendronephthya gigantea]|nr:leucine-rich repeat and guanylate kinase domain-containing protein-like isoform X2 [Dendronephthya gigantea]